MRNAKDTLYYVLKRLALMLITFLVIFVICFVLIRLLPANSAVGQKDPDTVNAFLALQGKVKKNPDGTYSPLPIIVQLFNYIKNVFAPGRDVVTGAQLSRFGYSFTSGSWLSAPDKLLVNKLAPTMIINFYSFIFSVPLGLLLGMYMALRKNKWEDNVLSILIMLFISVPSFVDAFLLQYFLGYKLHVLPPQMYSLAQAGGWFTPKMFSSMVLPVLAMSLGSIAGYARYTRAELTEVLTSDFMLLARTKGLTRAQATVRHAFRNSLVPIFPMILGEILMMLSGSIIIESIFGVNGVGGLLLDAITNRDLDVYQFVSMFYILIGLLGGLVVDVSYGLVDPRIRMGGGKA